MRLSTGVMLLMVCLTLTGGTAFADYVLIKYRSGNVQTLRLDEPSSKIVSISYQDDNVSVTEPPSSRPVKENIGEKAGEATTPPQKKAGTPETSNKPPVRIEWAPPVE